VTSQFKAVWYCWQKHGSWKSAYNFYSLYSTNLQHKTAYLLKLQLLFHDVLPYLTGSSSVPVLWFGTSLWPFKCELRNELTNYWRCLPDYTGCISVPCKSFEQCWMYLAHKKICLCIFVNVKELSQGSDDNHRRAYLWYATTCEADQLVLTCVLKLWSSVQHVVLQKMG